MRKLLGAWGGGGSGGRPVSRRGPPGWAARGSKSAPHMHVLACICSNVRQWWGGGGGSVGTPTYIPQNDPYNALIIWNIHGWGIKKFFRKICPSAQLPLPRSDLAVRSGVKIFCVFHPFLNPPQNSEYFEYRHEG